MNRWRVWIIAGLTTFLVAGLFSIALVRRARADTRATPPKDHAGAIALMRTINTAEYSYRHDYGNFGDWGALYARGYIKSYGHGSVALTKDPEPISGQPLSVLVSTSDANYAVTVLIPPDQSSYSIAIHDLHNFSSVMELEKAAMARQVSDADLYAVFSDPNGVIYEGAPIQ